MKELNSTYSLPLSHIYANLLVVQFPRLDGVPLPLEFQIMNHPLSTEQPTDGKHAENCALYFASSAC